MRNVKRWLVAAAVAQALGWLAVGYFMWEATHATDKNCSGVLALANEGVAFLGEFKAADQKNTALTPAARRARAVAFNRHIGAYRNIDCRGLSQ